MRLFSASAAVLLCATAGCTFSPSVGTAPLLDTGTALDADSPNDASRPQDAAPLIDAGFDDAGPADRGVRDEGVVIDPDLGFPDEGQPDAPAEPRCGDSMIDPGESCDDGDDEPGDGCDESCTTEPDFACLVPGEDCIPLIRATVTVQSAEVEEGENASFVVALDSAATEAVTITWSITDIDTDSDDFARMPQGDVTFAPGETSLEIGVPIAEDQLEEREEDFQFMIDSASPAFVIIGQEDRVTVTIEGEDPLTERGLVLRYFLDENMNTTDIVDRSPSSNRFALSISNGTARPTRTQSPLGRALSWSAGAGTGGAAASDVRNSDFLSDFSGTQQATVELMIDVDNTTDYLAGSSYLFWIGRRQHNTGYFTVFASNNRLYFGYDTFRELSWPLDLRTLAPGPHLITLRFDSTAQDKLDFFLDGVQFPEASDFTLRNNHSFTINTPASTFVALGNRATTIGSGRSFEGEMHYAALYNERLTSQEIAANYARLILDHDR